MVLLILKSEKKDELGNNYLNEVQRFASVVSSKWIGCVTSCHVTSRFRAAAQMGKVLWESAPARLKNKYFINNFMKDITGASNKVL